MAVVEEWLVPLNEKEFTGEWLTAGRTSALVLFQTRNVTRRITKLYFGI
jgi:hypothetical protein